MTEMISFRPIDHDLKNIKAILEANPHMRGNRSSAISLALDRLANGSDSFTVLDLLDMAGDKIEAQLRELEAVLDRDYEMDVVTHPKNARDKRHLAVSYEYIKLSEAHQFVSKAVLTLPSERAIEDMMDPNSPYWGDI